MPIKNLAISGGKVDITGRRTYIFDVIATDSQIVMGNLYFNRPKLFHTFCRYFNFIFSQSVHSFNHSTSVRVKIVHIDVKYCILEHFCKSVKHIILHCFSFDSEINLLSLKNLGCAVNLSMSKCSKRQYLASIYTILTCTDVE